MIGSRLGEIELLRHHHAPAVEEIGANGDDESSGAEIQSRPRHAVRLSIRRNDSVIGACIVTEMRRHPECGEPGIKKARETPALVLIDEDGGASAASAAGFTQLLCEDLQRFIPVHRLQLSILARHRSAIAVRIVETLQCRLSARTQCSTIDGMLRISFELDRAPVSRLGDHSAPGRAFAARRRVIVRDAGHCLIR